MRTAVALLSLVVLSGPAVANQLELNKELVRRMTDAINRRDFDELDAVVAPDVVRHCAATPGIEVSSLDEFKTFLRQDLRAVPDSRQEIQQMLAEGDRVAARVIYRGTQTGPMGPFPPSGKRLELPFIGILRIRDGKIAEIWVEWDNMAALAQLGHLPPPGQAPTTAGEADTTSAETRRRLARRWFDDVINDRNLAAIDETYASDYVYHGPNGFELHGPTEVRLFAAAILAASDDRHATVEQQVVKGDLVVTRFVSRGTNTGPWRGEEATGGPWTTEGIVISRVANGKIVEDWEVTASAGP